MRRQLVSVLKNNQKDLFSEIVLRCFWSLETPLPSVSPTCSGSDPRTTNLDARPEASVIDLAEWAHERGKAARP